VSSDRVLRIREKAHLVQKWTQALEQERVNDSTAAELLRRSLNKEEGGHSATNGTDEPGEGSDHLLENSKLETRSSKLSFPPLPDGLPAEFLALAAPVRDEVLYRVRYKGYLDRELRQVEKLRHLENVRVPADLDYTAIHGLRAESRQKLSRVRPATLAQAQRISGVGPVDISLLMVALRSRRE
jgi:tRNA uridine 5-carboxymethylaminomethyl modification enzyme